MNISVRRPWPLRAIALLRKWRVRSQAVSEAVFDDVVRRLLGAAYGRHFRYVRLDRFSSENGERWKALGRTDVRLSIVIVTYKQPVALECLLASLSCQTLQNFELLVIHDGADPATRQVADRFASGDGARLTYTETPVRYNDYGHSLRQIGMESAVGEYLLITNGDNYYVPRFAEFLFDAIDQQPLDVVLWDLVHSHTGAGRTELPCYSPFAVYPVRNMMDIGAMAVRT